MCVIFHGGAYRYECSCHDLISNKYVYTSNHEVIALMAAQCFTPHILIPSRAVATWQLLVAPIRRHHPRIKCLTFSPQIAFLRTGYQINFFGTKALWLLLATMLWIAHDYTRHSSYSSECNFEYIKSMPEFRNHDKHPRSIRETGVHKIYTNTHEELACVAPDLPIPPTLCQILYATAYPH